MGVDSGSGPRDMWLYLSVPAFAHHVNGVADCIDLTDFSWGFK